MVRRAALVAALVAAACTGEKAAALRVAASQFDQAAGAAVDGLGALLAAEAAPPARTEAQAVEEFRRAIEAIPVDEAVTPEDVADALNPWPAAPADVVAAREAFLGRTRSTYRAFAEAFAGLDERGAPFARRAVEDAAPLARRPAARMASFAAHVSRNPPRFLARRADLIAEVSAARAAPAAERGRRLAELREALDRLSAEEEAMARDVAGRCLRAAALGDEVAALAASYGRLSAEEIADEVRRALEAADVTGLDLGGVRARVEDVLERLRRDPEAAAALDAAVAELNGGG